MTLLEEAKKINNKLKTPLSDEEKELTLAVISGEVTITNASKAMGISGSGTCYRLVKCLIELKSEDKIAINN